KAVRGFGEQSPTARSPSTLKLSPPWRPTRERPLLHPAPRPPRPPGPLTLPTPRPAPDCDDVSAESQQRRGRPCGGGGKKRGRPGAGRHTVFRFRHFRVRLPLGSGRALDALSALLLQLTVCTDCPFPVPSGKDMSVPGPTSPDGALAGPPHGLGPGEPTPGLSDTSPDEGLLEDLTVEDKAVEQLAEGLLSHYLPDLQRSKQALQELTSLKPNTIMPSW
uniref:Biosis of lysosomal organelles complex 1 subunit 6 n=1 Tax=Canis lupus dingo TaxID=286419 RepID=A0A8C0LD99_CANLU